MGRSRSNSLSRKKSRRRSTSRSKHSKKSRHRTPEKKSSKYRRRSQSSSDSSSDRYKSSSKYKTRRNKREDSRSPTSHRNKYRRRSSSSSSTSSRSSNSSNTSNSKNTHRSSSSDKLHRNKPSSSYAEKIRAMRTPTPPQSKTNFEASVEFLDKRHVSDAIDEINANEFRPKTFNSSTNNKTEKTDGDIVKVKDELKSKANQTNINDDPLFHQKVFGDDDERMKQWVRRFYTYRQKAFASTN